MTSARKDLRLYKEILNLKSELDQTIKDSRARRGRQGAFRRRASVLASGLRIRSRDRAFDADIAWATTDYILGWLIRQPDCECCGVRFTMEYRGENKAIDSVPSFDRFDPSEGYSRENVSLICWKCNNAKGRTVDSKTLRLVADWMDKRVQDQKPGMGMKGRTHVVS